MKLSLILVTLFILASACYIVENQGIPPRTLGPYLEGRASGHSSPIEYAGHLLGTTLVSMDRGKYDDKLSLNMNAWLAASTPPAVNTAHELIISSSLQAIVAIKAARPGDTLTFLPGHYHFSGKYIEINQPGSKSGRITVRARQAETVFLEFDTQEGFLVSTPYWTFQNLNIRGVCSEHSNCEHAFHIVGGATHFSAYNNTISDFNAHFKINGSANAQPDEGILQGNTLSNSQARNTSNPVTPIDLVGASRWIIRHNMISDFIKTGGDQISYGAFAKGAGAGNLFENNIVLCEFQLRGNHGQRIGLSLGGGGTASDFCRDHRCITEQDGSIIQSNLIASCSDDGIYLNRAASSKILNNTLIDTGGIMVRFTESSADVEGNLVDGGIRSRNGGVLRTVDNLKTSMTALYVGYHPERELFVNADRLNLMWTAEPPKRSKTKNTSTDLCGIQRNQPSAYGAFEDFSACFFPHATKPG